MPTAITPEGVDPPSLQEAQELVFQVLSAIFGTDLSPAVQTPQGQIGHLIAVYDVETGEGFVGLYNGTGIETAVGSQLDDIAASLLISRRAETRSRVTATVRGTGGVPLPAGARAQTTAGDTFRTVSAAILSPSGVPVEMEAVEFGPIEAPAGTITRIVTVTTGWEGVTNTSDAAIGRAQESDSTFRANYRALVGRGSQGPLIGYEGALAEVGCSRWRVVENRTALLDTNQDLGVQPFAVLAVAEGATDAEVTRAIENHRSGGTPTMAAIVGGTADEAALVALAAGALTWNGASYTALDLTGTGTPAERAAALTTLLDGSSVTVSAIDGIYLATFPWKPVVAPNFGDSATTQAFGLNPDASTYPPGPFLRPRERALAVTMTIERGDGFPSDGLVMARQAVLMRVAAYGIGQQLWLNDILAAVEGIGGTRVTALTATLGGNAVNGVDVPLDAVWSLNATDVAITVT